MGYIEDLRSKIGNDPLILVRPTVIIINDKGEFLLIRHPHHVWSAPGGLMELGETTEEAARREIKEELGIGLGKLHLVGVFSGKNLYTRLKNGDEYFNVIIAYLTNKYTGNLLIDGIEVLEAKFFHHSELPESTLPLLKNQIHELIQTELYKNLIYKQEP